VRFQFVALHFFTKNRKAILRGFFSFFWLKDAVSEATRLKTEFLNAPCRLQRQMIGITGHEMEIAKNSAKFTSSAVSLHCFFHEADDKQDADIRTSARPRIAAVRCTRINACELVILAPSEIYNLSRESFLLGKW
jgi:hypothetical protein